MRTLRDWGGNLAAFALMIGVNVLSNALPINGQSMPEISARYPTLFTPAGFTFSIWGVIYLMLLAFVCWQALPSQRHSRLLADIGPWFRWNCIANAAWLFAWHYEQLLLSLGIMFGILVTLIAIYRRLQQARSQASATRRIALHAPFSFYLGWIALATIANLSVVQHAFGWDSVLLAPITWTLVKIAVAGAVGAVLVIQYRDVVCAAAIAWGAWGIAVMQASTPAVAGAAMTLTLAMLMLVVREGALRLRG